MVQFSTTCNLDFKVWPLFNTAYRSNGRR